MDTLLFTLALGLQEPWLVDHYDFDAAKRRIDIHVDFPRGARFACPECGATCPVHDTLERTWRHLDFFQHQAYLHARVPRVSCDEHGVHQVSVPWARPGSGFTLLFEAFVLALAKEMPVAAVARLVGETDTRLWRCIKPWVDAAVAERDLSSVRRIGIDETSRRRGHQYLTIVYDLDARRAIFATQGKDASTVQDFAEHLHQHGGDPAAIEVVSCDLSPAFTKGIRDWLPNATITYDKFHVVALANAALDEVRRDEQREAGWQSRYLKRSRWALLRNPRTQSDRQRRQVEAIQLPQLHLRTGRAYRLKLGLGDAYRRTGTTAADALKRWCAWASRSRLPPFVRLGRTIRTHWDGISAHFDNGVTNAVMEGLNSLVQTAKAKARGYRSWSYLRTLVYLIAGQLDLPTHRK